MINVLSGHRQVDVLLVVVRVKFPRHCVQMFVDWQYWQYVILQVMQAVVPLLLVYGS